MGVYLFLQFGLGPSPGWTDACVKAVLEVVRFRVPLLRMADFVGDLSLVDESGEDNALAAGMTGALSLLEGIGVRLHAKEGKRRWPTRRTPWSGFEVDTHEGAVKLEERKRQKGKRLCEEIFEAAPGSRAPARAL